MAYGLAIDGEDAHRSVQIAEVDWPLQACQVRPGGKVYVNTASGHALYYNAAELRWMVGRALSSCRCKC